MLHYKDRKNRIYVLTVDASLAADIDERIRYDPRLIGVEVVTPAVSAGVSTEVDVAELAKETITSRLVIFDVRGHTLPRLQEPYNRVVGFNRADLNERCFAVCIGDGPPQLFEPSKPFSVFGSVLAQCRLDYSAAAFFYDPMMHYTPDERPLMGIGRDNSLPRDLPKRLAKAFAAHELDVNGVRRYFRAAGKPLESREEAKHRRLTKLVKLYRERIRKVFRDEAEDLYSVLAYEGYSIGHETLRLHTYPCFFEDWIYDLLRRVKKD